MGIYDKFQAVPVMSIGAEPLDEAWLMFFLARLVFILKWSQEFAPAILKVPRQHATPAKVILLGI